MEERDIQSLAEGLGSGRRGIEHRWREYVEGHRTIFVAELNARPAGSVSHNQKPEFPRLLHLLALDVFPSHQGRGIGACLIQAVEEDALQRGLDGVFLEVNVENSGALRLYERMGYRRQGETFLNRWTRYLPGGGEEEVTEVCYRMFKHFGESAA